VATLCQLIPRKRVDLVIDAFVELAPAFPDWDLSIGGAGPLSEELQRRVPEELRHRVEFSGFVSKAEQPAFHESADLFVLASQEDGWGMVIPEAMASGLPVVSTRGVESAVEMLSDGGGALVPTRDGPALREAMRRFMADVSLCETEGERAREVAKRFSPPAIAECAAQDLRQLLHRSG
jgi:glycosyltransferase involved in cell wall biosynthesis